MHPIYMIHVFQNRWDCFNSISETVVILVFIGFYHEGVHPSDISVDAHQLCRLCRKVSDTFMVQIDSMCLFVIIAAAAEPQKRLITYRLLFETSGMKSNLISWI